MNTRTSLAVYLSVKAESAMLELLAGITDWKCVLVTEAVFQELGMFGLAYKFDRRSRSNRIVLTKEGAMFLK